MADISQYTQAIADAVQGDEVRNSIRLAIEAINNENIELNTDIRQSVSRIVTKAIEESPTIDTKIENTVTETLDEYALQPLIFTYDPSKYLDDLAHIDEIMTEKDIMSKGSMMLRWVGSPNQYEANYVCVGKYSRVVILGNHGCLYFYNAKDAKLIRIIINKTDSVFNMDIFDIGSGGGGGSSYTAGIGIDIINDEISTSTNTPIVLEYYVMDNDTTPMAYYIVSNRDELYSAVDNNKKIEIRLTYFDTDGNNIITNGKCEVVYSNIVTGESLGNDGVDLDVIFVAIIDGVEYTFDSSSFISKDNGTYDRLTFPTITTKEYQEKLTAGEGISITNGVISVNYDNGDTEVY